MAEQLKILIIEDNKDDAELAQAVLQDEGYEAHIERTVAAGIGRAAIEEPPYAAVVSDNRLVGETSDGIAQTEERLTDSGLDAGLVGWTTDKPRPTEEHIFRNRPDHRPFAFALKGGEFDVDNFLGAVESVLVPPKSN